MKSFLIIITLLLISQNSIFAQYSNGKCESGNCENGYGVYKFDNGTSYEGNWKNSLFHGDGKYIFLSGNYYEGQFVESKRHGKGKYFFVEGITFTGNFVNDTMKGDGEIIYKDGTKYNGSILNFKMHGKGKLTFPDGNIFSGNFIYDAIKGDGKINFVNGSVYEGNLKGFVMEGKGKYVDSSGFIYTGDFKNNRFTGKGEKKETNGLKYLGEFNNNLRHGLGTLIYNNGNKVTARWIMDSITNENLKVEFKDSKQIPMIPYANGLYKIPVNINNALDLLLLFDTGASLSSINEKNHLELIRRGTIKDKNFIKNTNVVTADEFKLTKSLFSIDIVKIGKFTFKDSEFAVFEEANVEPILGQNVISKFGKITIDFKNHTLSVLE